MRLLVLNAVVTGTSMDEDCLWHLEIGLVRPFLADIGARHVGEGGFDVWGGPVRVKALQVLCLLKEDRIRRVEKQIVEAGRRGYGIP